MPQTYLPSLDNPGYTFLLDVYKPQGRPAIATATEGKLKPFEFNGHKGESFEVRLFTDRRHVVPLGGANTSKRRAIALGALLADLEDKGWVAKGWGVTTD